MYDSIDNLMEQTAEVLVSTTKLMAGTSGTLFDGFDFSILSHLISQTDGELSINMNTNSGTLDFDGEYNFLIKMIN